MDLTEIVLIGPGSEWFWALAQFVVVVVTLGGIWRQLRAQEAANAIQRLEALWARWETEELDESRLALALDLQSRADAPMLELFATAMPVLDFVDNLAALHAEGHLSIEDIWEGWGFEFQNWIAVLMPIVERMRVTYGFGHYNKLDGLRDALAEQDVHRGTRGLLPTGEWLAAQVTIGSTRLRQRRRFRDGPPSGPPSDLPSTPARTGRGRTRGQTAGTQ